MSILDQYRRSGEWVKPSGHPHGEIAFVAEAPASNEVAQGFPLVGPSGVINWQFAEKYGGVRQRGAYVTNWRKVPFGEKQKKELTEEERAAWTSLLEEELAVVKPKVVIALGAWAVEALLGPGYSLFWAYGIPFDRGDFVVIPVVHPAAGLHKESMLPLTAHGYAGVKKFFSGEQSVRTTGKWSDAPNTFPWTEFANRHKAWPYVGVDTEGWLESPYMLTFSVEPNEAYHIYADDKEGLRYFASWIDLIKPTFVLHAAVHDAPIIRKLTGVNIWDYPVVDTMVLAYVLQDLPRGLKDLTKRQLNIYMEEYEDVVRPWQEAADEEWRSKAYVLAESATQLVQQFTPKTKRPRLQNGHPVYKRIGPEVESGILRHLERNQQLAPQEVSWIEGRIGPRPGMDLSLVPAEIREDYAGRDAAVTLGVRPGLQARIEREGLADVAALDHAVLPMIEDFEQVGMHVNLETYWDLLGEISTKKDALVAQMREMVGDPEFNPGSDDKVAEYLDSEGVFTGKYTKSWKRQSTEGDLLSQIKNQHPFIPLLLDYREHNKYESSYLLPLRPRLKQGVDGWRTHPDVGYTTVVSGRFNSRDLTWPARTELGLRMRSIFTAPEGAKLVSWDLSQIELRIAAAFSKDEVLLDTFARKLDPHTNLAARLFSVEYMVAHEGPGKQLYRTPAKNINYMLAYGGGPPKLYEMMGGKLSMEECERIFEDTWRVYWGLKLWMEGVHEEVHTQGMVSDFLGRRRFLPGGRLEGWDWPAPKLRQEAERQGGNYKIQGATAEIVKRAMRYVWEVVYPKLRAERIHLRFWLQVHDELMGEMRPAPGQSWEDAWAIVNPLMQEAMTADSWLLDPVGIETEGKYGAAWSDLK